MEAIAVAIICCGTLVWVAQTGVTLVHAYWARQDNKALTPKPNPEEAIPVDILGTISAQYVDEWAQEDAIRYAKELYGRLNDWGLVRARLFDAGVKGPTNG